MRIAPESEISLEGVFQALLGTKTAGDVDAKQLSIGVSVELEHGKDDMQQAEKIARDHLAEDPQYYTNAMKKNWGIDEAKKRAKEMEQTSKTAQTSGLKDCQRCRGKGGYFTKLKNPGTGESSEHYVSCDMPGCNHGKYDPSILCPECHDPDGREKTIQEISLKSTASHRPVKMQETFSGSNEVLVFKGNNKEPHFVIRGAPISDLDVEKVREYLYEVDWTDRGAPGWITPDMRCDDFVKDSPGGPHKIAKTFSQIHAEYDPNGTNHDLYLTCTACGNTRTCRCSKPKRHFEGICDECAGKTAITQQAQVGVASLLPNPVLSALEIIRTAGHEPNAPEHIQNEHKGVVNDHYFCSCSKCGMPITIRLDGTIDNLNKVNNGCASGDALRSQMANMWNANPNSTQSHAQTNGKTIRQSSVFVLEDDPARIVIFKAAFGDDNVAVTKDVKTALALLRTRKFAKVFLDRDLSSPTENGEDVAWQMEREKLCSETPVVIHSENTRGQRVMAKYLNKYHGNVSVIPFRQLKKQLDVPGGVKL